MSAFFPSLFSELTARRRRLRKALGDRGQSLFEMLILGGLAFGSAGLFVQPWMAAAAPWGFAIPFVFVAAYCLIEIPRQPAVKARSESQGAIDRRYTDALADAVKATQVKAQSGGGQARHDLDDLAATIAARRNSETAPAREDLDMFRAASIKAQRFGQELLDHRELDALWETVLKARKDGDKVRRRHDLAALALAIACAGAGAATFAIAFRAKPPEPVPVEEPIWRPPEGAVDVEIVPGE